MKTFAPGPAAALRSTLGKVRQKLRPGYSQLAYAQEGEDLILHRIFEGQRRGFYVDVGAHHPQRFSNTYLFYLMGWSGLNIDAMPGSMAAFRRVRPRDINLEFAVGAAGPPQTYYVFNDRALNTIDPEHARSYEAHGYKIVARLQVITRPLGELLDEYLPEGQRIDVLSVDVEGLDLEVLRSNDWERFQPLYILVETLHQELEAAAASPAAQYLRGLGYSLCAKTPNTAFFKRQAT